MKDGYCKRCMVHYKRLYRAQPHICNVVGYEATPDHVKRFWGEWAKTHKQETKK